jgi:pimeloyl-ACP methyl ester carboxylesterase
MDQLGVETAVLMGYSMGARLALAAALSQPERVDALILGGVGGRIFEPPSTGTPLAAAMEADNVDSIGFRSDMLSGLRCPTLVVAGARDALAGDPEELAAAIPGGRAAVIPACDHFSTIAHVLYKAAVFDFLDELPT